MNTPTHGTSPNPRRFDAPAFRHRAELPALRGAPPRAALHDFLVPNLRPDLAVESSTPAKREERRRFLEPDSIFWCPESHAGDAA